jgi:hypothetical protein
VAGLTLSEMRDTLTSLASEGPKYGYETTTQIDDDSTWLGTWANDGLYALVLASEATASLDRRLIDVHAGAAFAMETSGELFKALSTATWRFDFGGPWARVRPDGVAFGWRSRLPSELIGHANLSDAFGCVLGMIDAFGEACNVLAAELVPQFGGRLCRSNDPEAWPALLSGVLPPEGR